MVTRNSSHLHETPAPPAPEGPHDDRLVLTVAEAGKLLGISRAFAYELIARGELPVIRLGRRRLVPKCALYELVGVNPIEAVGRERTEPSTGGARSELPSVGHTLP